MSRRRVDLEEFTERSDEDRRQEVLSVFDDLLQDVIYYDRKEDETCPIGAIEPTLQSGLVTVDEVVERFRQGLIRHVNRFDPENP